MQAWGQLSVHQGIHLKGLPAIRGTWFQSGQPGCTHSVNLRNGDTRNALVWGCSSPEAEFLVRQEVYPATPSSHVPSPALPSLSRKNGDLQKGPKP